VNPPSPLQPGEFKRGSSDLGFGRLGWNWTANPHLATQAWAAYVSIPLKEWDVNNNVINDYRYREWVGGSRVVRAWGTSEVFEGGWTTRYVNAGTGRFVIGKTEFNLLRSGWRNDGYVQQASTFFGNRLHVVGSLRLDTGTAFDIHPVSPQLSASLKVGPSTTMDFAVGRYNQFAFPASPAFLISGQLCEVNFEGLDTANHFSAGVEHRLGEYTRIRASFFDRQDQRQTSSSGGCPNFPPSGFTSLGVDYARGAQIILQSRTANRLSGWIGYTYTHARQNSFLHYQTQPGGPVLTLLSPNYPTLADQLHTVNLFGSYRVSSSVHVSAKFIYGSGFPVPSGYIDFTKTPPQFVGFNATRLSDYQRLDVRAEKDWAFTKWKLALYGEVLNLTNHYNPRYITEQLSNGTVSVITEQGFPITPTAGLAFEF